MTEKIFIQLSDDTRDEVFEAAERISWYIPERIARFVAREIIISAHYYSQIPEAERATEDIYMIEILNDMLLKSGAAYKYILRPAAKSETSDADVALVKPKRALSCCNCARAVYCLAYNSDDPEREAANCERFEAIMKGDQQ